MSAINTNDSKAPVKKVKMVQFGILSPEEIRRMSVTEGGIRWEAVTLSSTVKPQGPQFEV
jgi:hypothetical protein